MPRTNSIIPWCKIAKRIDRSPIIPDWVADGMCVEPQTDSDIEFSK